MDGVHSLFFEGGRRPLTDRVSAGGVHPRPPTYFWGGRTPYSHFFPFAPPPPRSWRSWGGLHWVGLFSPGCGREIISLTSTSKNTGRISQLLLCLEWLWSCRFIFLHEFWLRVERFSLGGRLFRRSRVLVGLEPTRALMKLIKLSPTAMRGMRARGIICEKSDSCWSIECLRTISSFK